MKLLPYINWAKQSEDYPELVEILIKHINFLPRWEENYRKCVKALIWAGSSRPDKRWVYKLHGNSNAAAGFNSTVYRNVIDALEKQGLVGTGWYNPDMPKTKPAGKWFQDAWQNKRDKYITNRNNWARWIEFKFNTGCR